MNRTQAINFAKASAQAAFDCQIEYGGLARSIEVNRDNIYDTLNESAGYANIVSALSAFDAEVAILNAKLNKQPLPQVVQVSVRRVYGVPSIYPSNEAAKIFAAIAGTKTIQTQTLAKAKELGYRIEQVADVGQQLAYYPALAALVVG